MDKLQSKYIKWVVGVLAVIATAMMFLPQLTLVNGTAGVEALFDGGPSSNLGRHVGASWVFVGYIFMLVGGIIVTIFSVVLKKPENAIENFVYNVIGDVLLLAGGILVLNMYNIYGYVNVISTHLITGIGVGPVVAGILGILGAVAGGFASFLDLKNR